MGSKPTKISFPVIALIIFLFILVIGGSFYFTYRFAEKTYDSRANQQLQQVEKIVTPSSKQVRKITFKKIDSDEVVEILYDGTVNHYLNGKIIKSGRRGFMETQMIFRDYEKIILNGGNLRGKAGYQIIIETEQGNVIINPDDTGEGGDIIDNTLDHIDNTLNPTPTPTIPLSSMVPTPTPNIPVPSPTPNPSTDPQAEMIPFECKDYLQTGQKPLKISNIYCGFSTD